MPNPANEPIAIVGSACRFAGDVDSPSRLWKLLQAPHDLRQEIPSSRFSVEGFYHPDGSHHGHSNVKHAYFLNEDPSAFDAEFFGIKPAEAKAMDPQQRLLMEVVYEGLESAGMAMAPLKGSDTGVYVGAMFDDYAALLLRDLQSLPTYYATGTGRSILANRISYLFDWHGPSIAVDTACSSSLVAVHMAVQALREGDSRMALACGTNLILGPESFIIESKLKMLSPDGISRMWDQSANGYARGEGVAVVVLKTLSAALQDGDHIECIIREVGVNQDGATAGITMPSATAQEALIRTTYAKAGLDLLAQSDLPQYFEAHGTGTPAGDPTEAEAVYNTFCRGALDQVDSSLGSNPPLYVGSIKTVLGHTEGTAGVAALLKASLALQHGYIPPNLHFNQLSDRVAPFYKKVEIPKSTKSWPGSLAGPRRASVNSFGFGGTNAHAILEQYTPSTELQPEHPKSPPLSQATASLSTPFVLSASSQTSLRATLSAYADVLDGTRPEISLRDLAWTLRQRRSALPYRVSLAALSKEELRANIIAKLADESIGIKALPAAKLLGIFTGQGAQYIRMGAELIESSKTARRIIQELESHLAQLPSDECPAWSLQAQILDADTTRANEAAISQPLCTAIQILLVDLLRLAGVHFDAVVGHSSGEIAAAYAAGYLTARDAMYIAYYRGLYADLASSTNGQGIKGAMLAVGSDWEDATELCADELFSGRLTVAAYNSPSSVTISGDEDAIAELQIVLDDEEKFHRRLKVDKAYHSQHMISCVEPYVAALRRCQVRAQTPGQVSCQWVSSVYNKAVDSDIVSILCDTYWAENMTRPVLFSQAVSSLMAGNPCDLVLEVGPHPALKKPASQSIHGVLQKEIPYYGVLSRGTSAVAAVSNCLGMLWSHLDTTRVNLDSYERAVSDDDKPFTLVKGLPRYQWNHEVKYWHESRSSRKMRSRQRKVHPLLGDISADSGSHHMSWKNLLRVNEMEWLSGHRVQGQVVFPAAGYVSTALEASRVLAESIGKQISLIEIRDFVIHQAVVFGQDDAEVEVLISMADITTVAQEQQQPKRICAKFTYSAALESHNVEDLTLAASGYVEIVLGEADMALLPVRKPALPHTIDVESERFYAALAELGYDFSDRFRSLSALQRKHLRSTCLVRVPPTEDAAESLLMHPAELDAILQSIILAYSYPYDGQLRMLHLPTSIRHIRVNPALCKTATGQDEFASVDAAVTPREVDQRGVIGHVDLYFNESEHAAIQVQGASFMPLGSATAEDDRRIFSRISWIGSQSDGLEAAADIPVTASHHQAMSVLERISTFYLRKFHEDLPANHPARSEFPTNWYLNFARHITSLVESGKHEWAKKEWLDDSLDDILEASKPFSDMVDVQIMHLVGEQMPRVFRGETTILEQFRADGNDILDRYYAAGFGLPESARWVSKSVKQIVDRYPHMNILELGAGTGGATKAIFREIGQSFLSYTYTDISAAFFENASSIFSQHRDRMVFKPLDAEKDPLEQGYKEGAYDLVVAFFVIHATSDLEKALRNIRKLLKPGGFLVVGEGKESHTGVASSGFIFGTLPGWWLGAEAGRTYSPHVSPREWDHLLKSTGFSGVDTSPPEDFQDTLIKFHFVSQAVDDQVDFFREPLSPSPSWSVPSMKKLVIVGGQTDRSSHLVEGLKSIFSGGNYATELYCFKTLVDVEHDIVDDGSTVVSLTELDCPVFKGITEESFLALKKMFGSGKTLLWITSGRRDDEPFSNMTVGFGRTASHELPDLRLQQLDLSNTGSTRPEVIAEVLLRLHASSHVDEHFLWTVEPEIVTDEKSRHLLARLKPVPQLNDRYNSASRTIIREKDDDEPLISVQPNASGCMIRELSRHEVSKSKNCNSEDLIEIHTLHSTHSALKTTLGHKYLVLGVQPGTDMSYLALVPSLASVLNVPTKSAVPCPRISDLSNGELLALTAAHLVSAAVLHSLFEGQTLLAHNPTKLIAQALSPQAVSKGVLVTYTTDLTGEDIPDSWIKLPRYLGQAEIDETLFRAKPSAFAGFSNDDTQQSENEATMIASLHQNCQIVMQAKAIYSSSGYDSGSATAAVLGDILRQGLGNLSQTVPPEGLPEFTSKLSVSLDNLARGARPADPLSVIDWKSAASLPVHITRLDTKPMFRGLGSTYWIVGMSRALGISLIDWMIATGARYIVLTSRKPEIAPEWIASHKRNGATVVVMPCDVTDETRLREVHKKICETLPPIAGVMNGAMVLRDTLIRNMSFSQLTDVLRPKVDGASHLDRIFWDTNLDFFVLISSINCVVGNVGQANYAAANTFMCSLAGYRRKRGLRAATVNAGAIIGAGYMQRESRRALDQIVEKQHMMHLSEVDWCQALCEAIDASSLDSAHGPELTTGISDVPFDIPNAPVWYSNPMFSSFIVPQKARHEDRSEGKATASVQELLLACQSQQDMQRVIRHALATQLRSILQVTTSDEDLMAARSNEIGLDSLVSVDIRSWFLKNLRVNVPVLKIMGKAETMADLAQYALENLPAEIVPEISGKEATDSKSNIAAGERISGSSSESSRDVDSGTDMASSAVTTQGGQITPVNDNYDGIDWEAESRLPADMAAIPPALNSRAPSIPPRVIVLTGVSGLLGHHLLSHLLANAAVEKVICLAVRRLDARLQNKELPCDPRVVYHEGDLSQPLLGLTAQEAASIFAEADAVIHNGADTSHLKFFEDLRDSNVGSTVALLRLCLPRRIPMHYVSSAGIGVLYPDPNGFPEVSVMGPGCSLPPSDGSFGYLCSKWTNERILERVHKAYGLRVCIHRPSTIVREGEDAATARAQLDWVNALLHYARKIKAVPRVEHNRGALDLVFVGSACADVLRHVFDEREGTASRVTYSHQVGDLVIPMDRLQDIGLKEEGRAYQVLPIGDWVAKAIAAGLHPAVAALIEEMDAPGGQDYPKLLKSAITS